MEAYEKLKKIERLYERLKNENRNNDSYLDDLHYCFYECWSLKDWLLNDIALKTSIPQIKTIVDNYVKNDNYLKICFDIANREKHLTLTRDWVDGKIDRANIGVHYDEHISVGLCDFKINLIHVDDLEEYDSNPDKWIKQKELNNCASLPTGKTSISITQEYEVTDKEGNRYNVLYVLSEAINSWKQLLKSLEKL